MNEKGLQAVSRSDYDVKPEGTLAYRAVLDAINRFPDFGGYLFKHDDIQINVTAMSSWNTSSIWASRGYNEQIKNFTHPQDGVDWWWPHPRAGLRAVMNSLQGSKKFADKLVSCTGRNDTWPVYGGTADFFYLPSTAVSTFLKVAGYLSFHELFLEVAIPTYVRCFRGNVTLLELQFCSGMPRNIGSITFARNSCPGAPVLHPMKLSLGRSAVEFVHSFMYIT
eukprot:gene36939-48196_t